MADEIALHARRPDGSLVDVAVEIFDAKPGFQLRVSGGQGRYFADSNLFKGLMSARHELEAEGLLLCCQGSRADVFPSGMLQQMEGGRRAYHLRQGEALSDDDLVDIFAPADPSQAATVSEQKDFVMNFFKLNS